LKEVLDIDLSISLLFDFISYRL